MRNKYDVVVVGAGPIGSHVAALVADKGYSVLVLEEHERIGEPVQCAGIFSPKVIDIVGCENTVLNRIKGADVYSPLGNRISITAGDTKAIVVDRTEFDKAIVDKSINKGAESLQASKVTGAEIKSGNVEITFLHKGAKKTVKSQLLIGADGVKSNVGRWFGLPRAPLVLPGVQEDVTGLDCESDRVKIFVGRDIAPGFFAWIIPAGDSVRVGLCTKNNASKYLKRLASQSAAKKLLGNAKVTSSIAGSIPMGIVEKTYSERVMIVGDAAAQVKATSGGGIYPGLVCAGHCAKTALEALKKNDFSERFLARYQKRWTSDIGKELKKDWLLFKLFQSVDDDRIEEAFELLNNPKILRLIEKSGDIDYPSKLALPLVRKEPRFLRFATSSIKDFILG